MQPFLFGKQPAAPTSSRNVVQTYDEAVASGTLILSASGVKCKCGAAFGHDWGPLTRIKRECSTRAGASWRSSQLGKRTLETQPGDSAKEERERAAAIAGANAVKQRRKEEQEAELREAAARAAEAAAADEPGAGATSSPSLAPLFAAKMKFTCGVKVRPLSVKTLVCASVMVERAAVTSG